MSPGPARAITGLLADMRALPLIFYAAATTAYGAGPPGQPCCGAVYCGTGWYGDSGW